jgi:4a-hydroxytetrahydrobiopterin dehydratase
MSCLSHRELQDVLGGRLRRWKQSGKGLEQVFEFPDFRAALSFVDEVGEEAEARGHHPDIDIRYNRVKLTLTTHDAGGITQRDVALAETIEQVASRRKESGAA